MNALGKTLMKRLLEKEQIKDLTKMEHFEYVTRTKEGRTRQMGGYFT